MSEQYEKKLDLVLARIRSLLLNKHHDYGEDNLKKHGVFGILVRSSDKLARLEHLQSTQAAVENESARDTWMDLAGYAIQCLIMFFD